MPTTAVNPSRYGAPAPRQNPKKKKSFLKSAFSGKAIGGSLKGFATGGWIGAIAGGVKGAMDDRAANRKELEQQDALDYEQLERQRAMNRQRAVTEGLSKWFSGQASNPAFLRASKLGEPILMPEFNPTEIYGMDTEDWQAAPIPTGRSQPWWEGVVGGAAGAYSDYMNTRPAVPMTPTYRQQGQNPNFLPGTFYSAPGRQPQFETIGSRPIQLGGGQRYVPYSERNLFEKMNG